MQPKIQFILDLKKPYVLMQKHIQNSILNKAMEEEVNNVVRLSGRFKIEFCDEYQSGFGWSAIDFPIWAISNYITYFRKLQPFTNYYYILPL